jgi:hypothetical protein
MMLRRPTPALVISLVALFFSLTGAAFAAKHYVINSTGQINPKVLKALKGKVGPKGAKGDAGAAGAAGPAGAAGAAGATGAPGPFPDALPSGKTTRGTWALIGSGTTDPGETAISYVWPLATRPTVILVPATGPVPAGCSGSVDHPAASPGNVCIFQGFASNGGVLHDYEPTSGDNNTSGFQGLVLYARGAAAGFFEVTGTFAVTAP